MKYKYNKLMIEPKMQPKPANPGPQKRKQSASLRRPIAQSSTNQQFQINANNQNYLQHDPKEYRLLLHCFSTNIHAHYIKRHKDILGELEDLYKIPLTKEQKIALEEDTDGVVNRNLSKLVRDGLVRNSLIGKNINEYVQSYSRYQRTQLLIPTPNLEAMKTLQLTEFSSTEPAPKQYKSQSQSKNRPQTSVRPVPPQKNNEKTNILNLNLNIGASKNTETSIFKNRNTKQLMEYGYAYASVNTAENEEGDCFVYIRENFRKPGGPQGGVNKLKFHGRYHRHSTGFGLLDELGIQDVKSGFCKISDQNTMSQNQIINNQSEKHHSSSQKSRIQQKWLTKTNVNRFFNLSTNQNNTLSLGLNSHWNSKQKSRDELQREKIQNKILSMNGALSANAVKSQGYKPKSRCWGNQIVSAGKINCNSETGSSLKEGGKLLFSMIRYK